MKNILVGYAACLVLAVVPIGIIAIGIIVVFTMVAIAYQVAMADQQWSIVRHERTVESTDETGRTTRRVFRSVNGKTEMTEEVVE